MLETLFMFGLPLSLLAVVYLYYELNNTRAKFQIEQKENARKLFELSILNEVSDKIGYSLSSKDIAATIAATAEKLFPVSAVSYGIIENGEVEITTITHESVGPQYVSGVKEIVLRSIYNIDDSLKDHKVTHHTKDMHHKHVHHSENQMHKDTLISSAIHFDTQPQSYFNIPLVLNNRFTGMINITSKHPNAYQEEDMSMLYKIVNKAQLAIGRLETVIENEKGKVDSLVKSLSSGEIFFTFEHDSLHLFTINSAAKRFLNINSKTPDLIHVLESFHLAPNIIHEMREAIEMKKCVIYRNVGIGELKFNIYLTPVFAIDNTRVIGVALTMQDVTREHETQRIREGFTNMMIHELRAPLTAIKGAAELLMQPQTEEEDRIKMRLIIKNASERLLQDIDDMLDSAKIDAGRLSIEKKEADINTVIEKSVQELSYAASNRAILIENHLDHTIPSFEFDGPRISQVMANLLSNAIKYSDTHTIIEIFTRQKHDHVEIEVRDHGLGIESDKLGALFQPFSQAHFFQKAKGTGLGLYISKAIIDAHEGKIWLKSEVGKGTSAFFTVPRHAHKKEEHFQRFAN